MEPIIILETDVTLIQKPSIPKMVKHWCAKAIGHLLHKDHHQFTNLNIALVEYRRSKGLIPLANIARKTKEKTPCGDLPKDTQSLILALKDDHCAMGYLACIISDLPNK